MVDQFRSQQVVYHESVQQTSTACSSVAPYISIKAFSDCWKGSSWAVQCFPRAECRRCSQSVLVTLVKMLEHSAARRRSVLMEAISKTIQDDSPGTNLHVFFSAKSEEPCWPRTSSMDRIRNRTPFSTNFAGEPSEKRVLSSACTTTKVVTIFHF